MVKFQLDVIHLLSLAMPWWCCPQGGVASEVAVGALDAVKCVWPGACLPPHPLVGGLSRGAKSSGSVEVCTGVGMIEKGVSESGQGLPERASHVEPRWIVASLATLDAMSHSSRHPCNRLPDQ